MKPIEELARTVRSIFRYQRQQADGGKRRFGDQHAAVAGQLLERLSVLYLQGLKRAKGDNESATAVAAAAQARAQMVARSINETSRDWLEEGREPADVFSLDRAAAIAATEASNALHEAKAIVVETRKGRLKWVTGRKPCDDCRSLNGKTVRAGKDFVAKSGARSKHSPLHPGCVCRTEEV